MKKHIEELSKIVLHTIIEYLDKAGLSDRQKISTHTAVLIDNLGLVLYELCDNDEGLNIAIDGCIERLREGIEANRRNGT